MAAPTLPWYLDDTRNNINKAWSITQGKGATVQFYDCHIDTYNLHLGLAGKVSGVGAINPCAGGAADSGTMHAGAIAATFQEYEDGAGGKVVASGVAPLAKIKQDVPANFPGNYPDCQDKTNCAQKDGLSYWKARIAGAVPALPAITCANAYNIKLNAQVVFINFDDLPAVVPPAPIWNNKFQSAGAAAKCSTLKEKNILVVTSGGYKKEHINDAGKSQKIHPDLFDPACRENVIIVGGTRTEYGAAADSAIPRFGGLKYGQDYVDIYAPGEDVPVLITIPANSANKAVATSATGTPAAALVAGTAALMASMRSAASATTLRNELLQNNAVITESSATLIDILGASRDFNNQVDMRVAARRIDPPTLVGAVPKILTESPQSIVPTQTLRERAPSVMANLPPLDLYSFPFTLAYLAEVNKVPLSSIPLAADRISPAVLPYVTLNTLNGEVPNLYAPFLPSAIPNALPRALELALDPAFVPLAADLPPNLPLSPVPLDVSTNHEVQARAGAIVIPPLGPFTALPSVIASSLLSPGIQAELVGLHVDAAVLPLGLSAAVPSKSPGTAAAGAITIPALTVALSDAMLTPSKAKVALLSIRNTIQDNAKTSKSQDPDFSSLAIPAPVAQYCNFPRFDAANNLQYLKCLYRECKSLSMLRPIHAGNFLINTQSYTVSNAAMPYDSNHYICNDNLIPNGARDLLLAVDSFFSDLEYVRTSLNFPTDMLTMALICSIDQIKSVSMARLKLQNNIPSLRNQYTISTVHYHFVDKAADPGCIAAQNSYTQILNFNGKPIYEIYLCVDTTTPPATGYNSLHHFPMPVLIRTDYRASRYHVIMREVATLFDFYNTRKHAKVTYTSQECRAAASTCKPYDESIIPADCFGIYMEASHLVFNQNAQASINLAGGGGMATYTTQGLPPRTAAGALPVLINYDGTPQLDAMGTPIPDRRLEILENVLTGLYRIVNELSTLPLTGAGSVQSTKPSAYNFYINNICNPPAVNAFTADQMWEFVFRTNRRLLSIRDKMQDGAPDKVQFRIYELCPERSVVDGYKSFNVYIADTVDLRSGNLFVNLCAYLFDTPFPDPVQRTTMRYNLFTNVAHEMTHYCYGSVDFFNQPSLVFFDRYTVCSSNAVRSTVPGLPISPVNDCGVIMGSWEGTMLAALCVDGFLTEYYLP